LPLLTGALAGLAVLLLVRTVDGAERWLLFCGLVLILLVFLLAVGFLIDWTCRRLLRRVLHGESRRIQVVSRVASVSILLLLLMYFFRQYTLERGSSRVEQGSSRATPSLSARAHPEGGETIEIDVYNSSRLPNSAPRVCHDRAAIIEDIRRAFPAPECSVIEVSHGQAYRFFCSGGRKRSIFTVILRESPDNVNGIAVSVQWRGPLWPPQNREVDMDILPPECGFDLDRLIPKGVRQEQLAYAFPLKSPQRLTMHYCSEPKAFLQAASFDAAEEESCSAHMDGDDLRVRCVGSPNSDCQSVLDLTVWAESSSASKFRVYYQGFASRICRGEWYARPSVLVEEDFGQGMPRFLKITKDRCEKAEREDASPYVLLDTSSSVGWQRHLYGRMVSRALGVRRSARIVPFSTNATLVTMPTNDPNHLEYVVERKCRRGKGFCNEATNLSGAIELVRKIGCAACEIWLLTDGDVVPCVDCARWIQTVGANVHVLCVPGDFSRRDGAPGCDNLAKLLSPNASYLTVAR